MIATDPVCGIEVNTEDTKFISEYEGRTYYFDGPECQHVFEEDPETYVSKIPEKVYNEHGDRVDGSE